MYTCRNLSDWGVEKGENYKCLRQKRNRRKNLKELDGKRRESRDLAEGLPQPPPPSPPPSVPLPLSSHDSNLTCQFKSHLSFICSLPRTYKEVCRVSGPKKKNRLWQQLRPSVQAKRLLSARHTLQGVAAFSPIFKAT